MDYAEALGHILELWLPKPGFWHSDELGLPTHSPYINYIYKQQCKVIYSMQPFWEVEETEKFSGPKVYFLSTDMRVIFKQKARSMQNHAALSKVWPCLSLSHHCLSCLPCKVVRLWSLFPGCQFTLWFELFLTLYPPSTRQRLLKKFPVHGFTFFNSPIISGRALVL